MIGRAVILLIAVSLLVAMIGKLRAPRVPPGPAKPAVQAARKCPVCDAYVLGSNPSPCARDDCRFRRS